MGSKQTSLVDDLAVRIREAREQAGLTQERMAPMIGVSLRTLTRYESGETTRISADTLAAIARVTRKRLAFFVEREAA